MKKINGLLIIVVFLLNSFIYAQPPRGEEQQGGQQGEQQQGPPPIPNAKQVVEMVEKLDKEIKLTDNQAAAVKRLYNEHFETVKSKISGNTRPKREDMEALKKDLEKKVNSILTVEQKKGYAAFLKKLKNQPPPR